MIFRRTNKKQQRLNSKIVGGGGGGGGISVIDQATCFSLAWPDQHNVNYISKLDGSDGQAVSVQAK